MPWVTKSLVGTSVPEGLHHPGTVFERRPVAVKKVVSV
jgi:hypothetical protein